MAIPLARIIPRFIAKRRQQNPDQMHSEFGRFDSQIQTRQEPQNLSNDKMVLRELNQGVKSFEKIKKNTRLDAKTLESILEKLEKDGLMKVVQKQGMFGVKIELYPTDKGFKEYYS